MLLEKKFHQDQFSIFTESNIKKKCYWRKNSIKINSAFLQKVISRKNVIGEKIPSRSIQHFYRK